MEETPKEKEKAEEPTGEIEDINKIKNELNETKKLADDYFDRLLRLQAEFDNYKKRMIKEREEIIKYSNEKLILELLEVYENLEKGIEAGKVGTNTDEKDALLKGMELVYKQFKDVLEKNGLKPIQALGEKFDPYKHEALMQTIDDSQEENTILEEFQRGYTLNNKVIRYSKVRVSKKL